MTREVTRRFAAAAMTAALVTVAGCTSHTGGSEQGAAHPGSAHASAVPRPREPVAASATPGVPTPGSMEKPATSSGPLSKRSFPTPAQLGAGWRYLIDPGDAEDGYAGNGTPALARGPLEIVQTALPFGCSRRARMPRPVYALEVDYRFHRAKVIAVRGSFSSPAWARAFFSGRARNVRVCANRHGPLVRDVSRPVRDAMIDERTPRSYPWREVAVLDGKLVTLVAVQGSHSLTDSEALHLIRLIRS